MDNFEHALEKENAMLRAEMERLTRERDEARAHESAATAHVTFVEAQWSSRMAGMEARAEAAEAEAANVRSMHVANMEAGIRACIDFDATGIGNPRDGVLTRALAGVARLKAAEADNAALRSVLERVEYCQTSGPMDEMRCPECGDTRSATCLPRRHDACDLGRALHGSSNPGAALLERLESAERWMGVVRDELVNAGGRPGDRDVALANLRSLLELDAAVRQYQHRDELDTLTTLRRLLEERSRLAHCIPPGQAEKFMERLRAAEASAKAWEEQHKQTERLRRAQGDRLDAAIAVVESARAFCGEPEILAALAAYDAAKEGT